jgi:hypothetical protein
VQSSTRVLFFVLIASWASVSCRKDVAVTGPRGAPAAMRGEGSDPGEGGVLSQNPSLGSGPLAMFGTPRADRAGTKGPYFGSGDAKSIVFVFDTSGSMIGKFSWLMRELDQAVNNLRASQSFDIILFEEGKAAAVYSRDKLHAEGLAPVSKDTKHSASAFLEDAPRVRTPDPLSGLRAAFARQPDLIYLLTDGDYADHDAVLKAIRDLNRRPDGTKAKINTVAYTDRKNDPAPVGPLLEIIAKENGGTYFRRSDDDMD